MTALSLGWIFSASTVACAKNGRNVSLTPSRDSNAALARSRSRAMLVTSASTTVVSWAEVCSDSTIRLAMTCRGLDIRWVVPRSADGAPAGRGRRAGRGGVGGRAVGGGAGRGGGRWHGLGRRRRSGGRGGGRGRLVSALPGGGVDDVLL